MDEAEQDHDSIEMTSHRPLAVSIQLHESLLASASEADGLTLPSDIFEEPSKKNGTSTAGWMMMSEEKQQSPNQATAVHVKTTTDRKGQVVFVEHENSNSNHSKDNPLFRRRIPLHPTILTIEPSNNNGNADESDTTTRIKDLGKKAKARLQEEKSKRPEIVVLHENETTTTINDDDPPAAGIFVPTPKPIAKTTKPRKRKTSSSNTATSSSSKSKTQRRRDNDNIDDWMPDISHLAAFETEKDPQWSNIVQLHGVPTDCTMESIKRFFKGLQPERVLVLVPNRCRIDRLDSTEPAHSSNKKRRRSILVERHDPTELRVFCKFATAPTAALAKERSGETLMLLEKSDENDKKGAAIAVSQVEKKLGMALMNTLAIEGVPKRPLQEVLTELSERLHPMVRTILWSFVARDHFGIVVDPDIHEACLFMDDDSKQQQSLSFLERYRKVATHHNKLADLHEALLNWTPFPSTELSSFETDSIKDPVVRLTSTAVRLLETELDRLDVTLRQWRMRWKLEQQNAGDGATTSSTYDSMIITL